MNLVMTGVNFRTAPLALREKLSFRKHDIPGVLQRIKWEFQDAEFVLLSTCNRTELYAAGELVAAHRPRLWTILTGHPQETLNPDPADHCYVKQDLQAVEHLFAVAASLDSMVIGETEILGQVKQAYFTAAEAATTGPLLNPLFQQALTIAKRVHSETHIGRGRVSVGSVAVEFAEKIFRDLPAKTVMIVGAGETSELTLQNLVARGVRNVLVLNRSLERGRALADRYDGKAIQIDLLDDYLSRADIVISSTDAPHPVLRVPSMTRALAERRGRPVLLVDLAVPRDIEPAVGELVNVYLYNIDDLQGLAAENLKRRRQAVEHAQQIVRDGAARFDGLLRAQGLGALIRDLETSARQVKDAELARAFARQHLASLPEECREEIRQLLDRTINQLLANPKSALKQAAQNGQADHFAEIARKLFNLNDK
ncbi:MAG: glutamyl-tRNA reductase [Phycisphaerae bacterium]|nr:glutamyl-tRNA reductase [Phycisphaerae bacterium]